jgi:hypothetical protein
VSMNQNSKRSMKNINKILAWFNSVIKQKSVNFKIV